MQAYWEEILPSKSDLILVKCQNHITLVTFEKRVVFFQVDLCHLFFVCLCVQERRCRPFHGNAFFRQERDGPYCPVLRLLQQFPEMLPKMRVDIGGCKHVLGGANIMCPGLTSKGGCMDEGM